MSDIVVRSEALPSLEKARALLERCRSTQECMHIKALAQAVASAAASEQAKNEAAAIVLLAKARVGELTRETAPPVPNDGSRNGHVPVGNVTKPKRTDALAAQGLSRKDAAECEKLADLKRSGDLDRMIRRPNGAVTTAAALTVSKLPPAERSKVFAKLGEEIDIKKAVREIQRENAQRAIGEVAPLTGKYRVLYADPPWKYGDSGYGHGPAEFHYPTMTIAELCALPIKELALDDSVLFMWVTSPLLEECFDVIRAWGFKYKASFVWDKIGHNVGHYVSVRHEFLLICTRGSCTPDDRRLIDSVQSIDRGEHSEKPEAFRGFIQQMYPLGSRIELFARCKVDGWAQWGNQI